MFIRKIMVSLAIAFLVICFTQINASAATITVFVNGAKQIYDQPPVTQNGRILVPIRGISERLGATVDWDLRAQTITIKNPGTTIFLKIGSKTPIVNGTKTQIDVPAQLINGRTMVPLRFVAEALKAGVAFDSQSKLISVTTKAFNEIVKRNEEKVVLVHKDKHGARFQYPEMGVIVSPSLVLTTYYAANHAESASIELSNGKELKIEGIVDMDSKNNLALMKLAEPTTVKPVTYKPTSNFIKGQKATAIKWQSGGSKGIEIRVDGSITYPDIATVYFANMPYSFKYPGSPMFNEKDALIGLVDKYGSYENKQYVRPLPDLKKWEHYFSMEHANIKTSGFYYELPQQKLKTFTNLSLGMTMDEVKTLEQGKLVSEFPRSLTYRNNVLGPDWYASYDFNRNLILNHMSYVNVADYSKMTRTQAEELFKDLKKRLEAVHGTPQELDRIWKHQSGENEMNARWLPKFNEEKPVVVLSVEDMVYLEQFRVEVYYFFDGSYKATN
ncbi:stalk domain-containing protein [Peribacillus loiseleuriae]|uniref:stalk domain-containing protein n=1 Tax=Peribacillus loiseleuriae TaxID=1679170 RepID=UPI0038266A6C